MRVTFKQITMDPAIGYRIAAAWDPNNGFADNFFVYVWDMNNAPVPLNPVSVGDAGQPAVGDLTIQDPHRTYTFRGIQLISAELGATRGYRYRQLTFQYTQAALYQANGDTPITLQNDDPYVPNACGLGDQYTYDLGDGNEQLLGFRYRPTLQGRSVVRFSTFRNHQNCFLQKVINANNERNHQTPMSGFTVATPQQNFNVNRQTLSEMTVDETFGYMHGEKPAPLSGLVDLVNPMPLRSVVTWPMQDNTPMDLIKIDANAGPLARESSGLSVETATFVFTNGSPYQNIAIH